MEVCPPAGQQSRPAKNLSTFRNTDPVACRSESANASISESLNSQSRTPAVLAPLFESAIHPSSSFAELAASASGLRRPTATEDKSPEAAPWLRNPSGSCSPLPPSPLAPCLPRRSPARSGRSRAPRLSSDPSIRNPKSAVQCAASRPSRRCSNPPIPQSRNSQSNAPPALVVPSFTSAICTLHSEMPGRP